MIRTAIIGYGYMGEIRRKVVETNPEMQLVAVCEPSDQIRSKISGLGTDVKIEKDAQRIIENKDIDLAILCTPNHLLPELTVQCLKTGKHVFCEKPPGRNLQDIQMICAEEKKHPTLKLMFGFNHRFHPGIQRAKKLIQTGNLGNILWVRGLYGKSGGKNFAQSWRNDPKISGGGILLDQGIHMLDLFTYFCGDFPQVKAFTGNDHWQFPVEDNAFVILKNDKHQAILHSSATLWKHRFQIEIGMDQGYIMVQGLLSKTGSYGRETLIIGRRQFEDEAEAVGNPSEEIIYFDKDQSWEMEISNLVQCIKNNEAVKDCSSAEALRVMRIIDQAYKDSQGVQ